MDIVGDPGFVLGREEVAPGLSTSNLAFEDTAKLPTKNLEQKYHPDLSYLDAFMATVVMSLSTDSRNPAFVLAWILRVI